MQLIGLHGRAGAGKDSIADYLEATHGFLRWGFADALYNEVAAAYGITLNRRELTQEDKDAATEQLALARCTDDAFAEVASHKLRAALGHVDYMHPLSLRWVLQTWGTEYRRASNDRYWLDRADDFIRGYLESLKVFEAGVFQGYRDAAGLVCIDLRFANERELIEEYGGTLWHVKRPGVSISDAASAAHVSEQALEMRTGDKLILNYGPLEALGTGVELALQGNDIVNTRPE